MDVFFKRNIGENRNIWIYLAYIIGLGLPFLLVIVSPVYHVTDVNIFIGWGDCLGKELYNNCIPKISNYPPVGSLVSGGALRFIRDVLDVQNRAKIILVYRFYLACFDALNFLLLTYITRTIGLKYSLYTALGIFLILFLPAGGSLWGQIDGMGLFFCLSSTVCFYKSWNKTESKNSLIISSLWFTLGCINLVIFISIKQLFIFSLPFFILLILISIYKFTINYRREGLKYIAGGAILSIIIFLFLDRLYEVTDRFFGSGYLFVWKGGGSEHANKIGGNGFNIWVLLGRDQKSSSHIPFLNLKLGGFEQGISPYRMGIFLYLICISYILFNAVKKLLKIVKTKIESQDNNNYLIAFICLFHGLSYLAFNVLLSGTHQRYLYVGYPFLLIGIIWFYEYKKVLSTRAIVACLLAAFSYAGFLYSQITAAYKFQAVNILKLPEPNTSLPQWLFPLQRHEFLATIHLLLLIFLLDIWRVICKQPIKKEVVDSTSLQEQET